MFLNGLAIMAFELKCNAAGQNYENAILQYRTERNPKTRLFGFKAGVLVSFAMDLEEVYMTTKLDGEATFFLPFNMGKGEGIDQGAGNPIYEQIASLMTVNVIAEFGKEEKTLNSKTDFDYVIPYDNWLKTLDVTRVYNQITREVASITVNDVPVEGTLTKLNGANNVVKEANGIELSNYIVDTVSHAHGHGHGHGSGNAGGGIVVPE